MASPLEGIKILELIRVAPGAFCTMMLADVGAEVLRIETPTTEAAMDTEMASRRAAFSFVNRNKHSMALNLKHPAGQDILHQIVQNADVLVEGFRLGVMTRLDGDYDTLSKINPVRSVAPLAALAKTSPIVIIWLMISIIFQSVVC